MSDCKENDCYPANWLSDGKNLFDQDNVIGMWEEPKISIEDLPKPFTPTQGDTYFYICGFKILKINKFFENSTFDTGNSKNGQCFRTEEDAQKWLDFMKSMME